MADKVPAWLDKEFMQDILRKSEEDETIRIKEMNVKRATSEGDNYSSDIYRIRVELVRKDEMEVTSLIVKTKSTEVADLFTEMFEEQGIFEMEVSMMKDTLFKMNRLLGDEDRVSARFVYANLEQPILIVMEDLASLGFRLADRQAGLDLAHSLLAIRQLAKFHGSSVAVCEGEPEKIGLYEKTGTYGRNYEILHQFYSSNMKLLAEKIANWPEMEERYVKKILRFSEDCYRKVRQIVMVLDNFNVLTHGDCWVNNMMFRYDENGKPVQQIFVDFQMPMWGSPALDLQYFINTSLSPDVDLNHRDLLLREYRKTLSSTMTRCGCKRSPPTEPELAAAMDRLEVCGMLATLTALPIILVNKDDIKSLKEIMENKNSSSFDNERLRKVLLRRIPEYDKKGLLDL